MDLIQLIGNLGFPIAISVYLLISDSKLNKLLVERIERLESYQRDVLKDLVENNTRAMIRVERTLNSRPCLSKEQLDLTEGK